MDNEFLERYASLQSHHEERKRAYALKQRLSQPSFDDDDDDDDDGGGGGGGRGGPVPEARLGIKAAVDTISEDEVGFRAAFFRFWARLRSIFGGLTMDVNRDIFSSVERTSLRWILSKRALKR